MEITNHILMKKSGNNNGISAYVTIVILATKKKGKQEFVFTYLKQRK